MGTSASDTSGPGSCDVAIVGYGPVGQTLAALLGAAGHHVEVLERHAEIYPLPRAVHLDHEIMRILQALGVADELAEKMHPIGEYHWFGADGEPIITMHGPRPAPSGWEPDYMFFQPQLEQALDGAVRALPSVRLRRGRLVSGLAQDERGVRVESTGVDGGSPQELHARYVIGADGANSIVRAASGIAQRDLGFRERWLVVDVLPHDVHELDRLPDACQWCDPRRPHMHARNGVRHRRFEFMLLPGESPADFEGEARVWELLAPFISPSQGELTRHAVYEFRAILAEQMRAERMLLAGDAAHLTPPFMGQGMCTGMRDAINIAWKLDLVLRGLAPDALLDTVFSERVAQTEWIVGLAVEMGRVSCELDRDAARARDAALRDAPEPPPLQFAPIGEGARRGEEGDPLAGQLAVQGLVSRDGVAGRFDDVVGRGFVVLAAAGDPRAELSAAQLAGLQELDCRFASLEQLTDCDGRLREWLDAHHVNTVIVRPDFYVYGSAAAAHQVPALVEDLLDSLTTNKETAAHA
jgi:2-polyprenyl-6-methoxyphenol hydroxylase-like FAD-dependent oxidoreductase